MFSIQCDNKKCREYQSPTLEIVKNDKGDIDYNASKVICSECNLPINNLTIHMKISMRGLGQIKRADNPKKAFAIECQSCHKKDQPIMANKEITCKHCESVYSNLPAPFKQTLLQFLGSAL